MLKLNLQHWLLLTLTLLFFLWFIGQQTPKLSLDNLSPNFTTSTFYQVSVSTYATPEESEKNQQDLTFNEKNQNFDKQLFLPLEQQARVQKLHLDAAPAVEFMDLRWQWQDFLVEAKNGFSKDKQLFLENIKLSQADFILELKTLTVDLKNRSAKSNEKVFWQTPGSTGQAANLLYQGQRLHLSQVETWLHLDEKLETSPVIPMPLENKR